MTIDMLFKIALLIVVCGFLSGVVFKVALVMVVVLLFVQLIR